MTRPEFPRLVRLGPEAREVTLTATQAECDALAERFGILGIGALSATLRLQPEPGGGSVRARGNLSARVEQTCVVTLEPVVQTVKAPIDLRILTDGEIPGDDDPGSPDEIESEGGQVDLGEAVAEQLSLALDPYPRAEGAALPEMDAEEPETPPEAPEGQPNPFAKLARLKPG